MAVIPFLMSGLLDDYRRPTLGDLFDQHFGMGLTDNMFSPVHHSLLHMPLRSGYLRPWRHIAAPESGVSRLSDDKNEFKINLDVQQFKPEELKVTVDNGYLVVDGKHEERSDEHGFISRHFTRRYKIPEDVDSKALVSKLSSDGVLSLQAPKLVSINSPIMIHTPIYLDLLAIPFQQPVCYLKARSMNLKFSRYIFTYPWKVHEKFSNKGFLHSREIKNNLFFSQSGYILPFVPSIFMP